MMDGLELQMLAKLGVVLLLIFPALWALRRLVGAPNATGWRYRMGYIRVIHLLETQPLAEGQRLYLVRVQGRHLLLGGGKESLTLLAELEGVQQPEAADAPRPMGWDQVARRLASLGGRRLASWGDRLRLGRREAL
jgi:flagellar biogenesis protein FliO